LLKRIVSGIALTLLLISMLTLAFNIQTVKASGTIYIRADGSIDPPTAPIATVDNVTYTFTDNINDSIVVQRNNIIIDGSGYTLQGRELEYEYGFRLYRVKNVTIITTNINGFDGFGGAGIVLDDESGENIILGNIITNCFWGIEMENSFNNVLRANNMIGNRYHFAVYADGLCFWNISYYIHDVDSTNLVDNKPIYYWVNKRGTYIPPDAGYVALVNCTDITIEGLNLQKIGETLLFQTKNSRITNNYIANNFQGIKMISSYNNSLLNNKIVNNYHHGVVLSFSDNNTLSWNEARGNGEGISVEGSRNNLISNNVVTNNTYYGISSALSSNNNIFGNDIANNFHGVSLWGSSDNVSNNNIAKNGYGIYLYGSSGNLIFHNNFVQNTQQAIIEITSFNIWDDGYPSGGNYWSDYSGTDFYNGPYQNETGSDGIGDTPYVIDANNTDRFPLMKPWNTYFHDIGILNVEVSKTVIGQGFPAEVYIKVINYGEIVEAISFEIYANETLIGNGQISYLTPMNQTNITFRWNTSGFAKGNYTIWAYAWPVEGETDTADNTFVDGWILVTISGDINGDFKVDIKDLVLSIKAFGSYPTHPRWNPSADFNNDNKIDIRDLVLLLKNFGEHYP